MAIQIYGQGSREAVIKHVQAFALDDKTSTPEEVVQLPALKVFIVSEINSLDTEFNGVNLNAQGVCHKGQRNVTVNLAPLKLHL